MAESSIEWTDYTFNPWIGCEKCAAGCKNCYAEKNRFVVGKGDLWGKGSRRHITSDGYWRQPLRWNALAAGLKGAVGFEHRPRVFCASLADVFEDREDLVEPRKRLWHLIMQTPELDWLILTKRPENIERLSPCVFPEMRGGFGLLKNVWLGTSASTQDDFDRNWQALVRVAASVRFISFEPLLESIDACLWNYPAGIRPDWIIVGGESGHGARPCDVQWIRWIVEQCQWSRCPVFVKQLGSYYVDAVNGVGGVLANPDPQLVPTIRRLKNRKGSDPAEWPEDLRVREFPESAKGATSL